MDAEKICKMVKNGKSHLYTAWTDISSLKKIQEHLQNFTKRDIFAFFAEFIYKYINSRHSP